MDSGFFRRKGKPAGPRTGGGGSPVRTGTGVHAVLPRAVVGAFYGVVALSCGLSIAAGVTAVAVSAQESTAATVQPAASGSSAASSYASAYLAAWLSATSTDHAELDRFLGASATEALPAAPWVYKDLAVVSVEQDGGPLVAVTVAASVQDASAQGVSGGETASWIRRHYQVVVAAGDNGSLAVVGLPAPVAGPAVSDTAVSLKYPQSLPVTGEAAATVTGFLRAYAAADGDVGRYVSPGSRIGPIDPAPYRQVRLVSLLSSSTPAEVPADGDRLEVLATASLLSGDRASPSTYALTLRARAGRWEVAELRPVPVLAETTAETPTGEATITSPDNESTGG
jgi:hypothetical protein